MALRKLARALGVLSVSCWCLGGLPAHASIPRNTASPIPTTRAFPATPALPWWKTLLALPKAVFEPEQWGSLWQPAPTEEMSLVALLPPPPPPCLVEPLSPMEDPEALAFEAEQGAAVHVAGLTPPTRRAMFRFEHAVEAVGGTFTVTSAYRPAAYQEHLQQVWDKWVWALRDNPDPSCGELRARVEQEFIEHGLLDTQRPVAFSDHTKGVGFDAAVTLPELLPRKRRAATPVDQLAQLCGLVRPAPVQDRVHFRLR